MILRRVTLLDPAAVGAGVSVFVQVTLEKQVESRLAALQLAVQDFPEVMECYLMTGDSDYLLRVVVPDVDYFQRFMVDKLSKTRGSPNIRSSFALKQVKYGQHCHWSSSGRSERTVGGRDARPAPEAHNPALKIPDSHATDVILARSSSGASGGG